MNKDFDDMPILKLDTGAQKPKDFNMFTGIVENFNAGKHLSYVYMVNGAIHRDDGPAVMFYDTEENPIGFWWLNGKVFNSKEDWFESLTPDQKVKAMCNPQNFIYSGNLRPRR